MIKILVVILFLLVLLSLSGSLIFLLKDIQKEVEKRALYALGIRIGLASLLLATIAYGLHTGELGSRAPWDVYATPGTPLNTP